jgi:cell division protein FtsL
MTRGRRPRGRKRLRGRRILVVAGWLILLLSSLSLVTWRQARGIELEQALRQVEMERAIAEAERLAAARRVEELRSRSRIVRVAREELGMHLPGEGDIVFLPVQVEAP